MSTDPTPSTTPRATAWVTDLARRHDAEHEPGCLGTVRYIDARARLRGVASVVEGRCLSLARPMADDARADRRERGACVVTPRVDRNGDLSIGTDRVELEPHGVDQTHIDGLTHIGVGDTWHGGVPSAAVFDDDASLAAWAAHGITTRGVLVDVPARRGTSWAAKGEPVTGDELDACLAMSGVEFEPGDALLLYMGRDRFEAEGHEVLPIREAADGRPGVDQTGAVWLADNRASVLCWDFLDAHGGTADTLSVHMLVWAVGLALVDNCNLGPAAVAVRGRAVPTGQLTVAALGLPRATGCVVNPLLVI